MAYVRVSPKRSDGQWHAASHRYPLIGYGLGAEAVVVPPAPAALIAVPMVAPKRELVSKEEYERRLKPVLVQAHKKVRAKRKETMKIVGIAVGVAAAATGVWWFFLRPKLKAAATTAVS